MTNNANFQQALTRGTVVFVKNERANGHVMSGNHPAVIIQNDVGNKYSPMALREPRRKRPSSLLGKDGQGRNAPCGCNQGNQSGNEMQG